MKISIAKETSSGEKRVLMLPGHVAELIREGHEVLVEKYAGAGINIFDRAYEAVGARISSDRGQIFGEPELVVKLKAPTEEEFGFLDENVLFSMLHHEQNPAHVYHLGRRNATAVQIESIVNDANERLIDATDITGEVGVLYAAQHLLKMPQETQALILGYGRVGSGAIAMCNQLGIRTKILRREEYPSIEHFLKGKDLLVNAIAWPEEERNGRAYVVTREMIRLLDPGAVILDLAVDYPNPIQTCRPTSLDNPFYVEEGRVHIGIYGYPGLVPISSSRRYSGQVIPLIKEISNNGGLEGLAGKSDIGRFIANAIVDPERLNWQSLQPAKQPATSLTE